VVVVVVAILVIVIDVVEQWTVVLHVKEVSHLQAECRACSRALSNKYNFLPVATIRQLLVSSHFQAM